MRRTLGILGAIALVFLFDSEAGAACQPGVGNPLGVSRVIELDTRGGKFYGSLQYRRDQLGLEYKEVVLTFDDGPLRHRTNKVLDALKAHCTHAMFFTVGRMATYNQSLLRRIVQEGHTLAHHTWSHPRTLKTIDHAQAVKEIFNGVKTIEIIAYGSSGKRARTPFFRFPGLVDPEALNRLLAGHDFGVFSADIVGDDWKPIGGREIMWRILKRLERRKKGIILLHDIKKRVAAHLPFLLVELKRRGYKVVAVKPVNKAGQRQAPVPDTKISSASVAKLRERFSTNPVNFSGKVFARPRPFQRNHKWRNAARVLLTKLPNLQTKHTQEGRRFILVTWQNGRYLPRNRPILRTS